MPWLSEGEHWQIVALATNGGWTQLQLLKTLTGVNQQKPNCFPRKDKRAMSSIDLDQEGQKQQTSRMMLVL